MAGGLEGARPWDFCVYSKLRAHPDTDIAELPVRVRRLLLNTRRLLLSLSPEQTPMQFFPSSWAPRERQNRAPMQAADWFFPCNGGNINKPTHFPFSPPKNEKSCLVFPVAARAAVSSVTTERRPAKDAERQPQALARSGSRISAACLPCRCQESEFAAFALTHT